MGGDKDKTWSMRMIRTGAGSRVWLPFLVGDCLVVTTPYGFEWQRGSPE